MLMETPTPHEELSDDILDEYQLMEMVKEVKAEIIKDPKLTKGRIQRKIYEKINNIVTKNE